MRIENIDKFLQEIGRAPLLSTEQELELLKAIQEKGQVCDEMEQLSQSNMRFVVALAAQYQQRGLTLEELISIGVEGLPHCATTSIATLTSKTCCFGNAAVFGRCCCEEIECI